MYKKVVCFVLLQNKAVVVQSKLHPSLGSQASGEEIQYNVQGSYTFPWISMTLNQISMTKHFVKSRCIHEKVIKCSIIWQRQYERCAWLMGSPASRLLPSSPV